jgi:hypothetical protein
MWVLRLPERFVKFICNCPVTKAWLLAQGGKTSLKCF